MTGTDTNYLFFILGACFLLVHEMDAVRCREWRIHPLFSWIADEATAYRWFTALHVPLYAALAYCLAAPETNSILIFWLNVFFVGHAILHLIYARHPKNEFRSLLSRTLIGSGGLFGALGLFALRAVA